MKTDCRAAAGLAKEVAAEGDALTLGGISQTPSYLEVKYSNTWWYTTDP